MKTAWRAPDVVEQSDQVTAQGMDVIGLDIRGPTRAAVAALVRGQHVVAGGRQHGDLMTPGEGQFGVSVHEYHQI